MLPTWLPRASWSSVLTCYMLRCGAAFFLTWRQVFTLIITAGISAVLFLFGTGLPSKTDQQQLVSYQNTMLRTSNATLLSLNASNNALPTPNTDLAANISALSPISSKLGSSKSWLSGSDVTQLFNNVNYLAGNNTMLKWGA